MSGVVAAALYLHAPLSILVGLCTSILMFHWTYTNSSSSSKTYLLLGACRPTVDMEGNAPLFCQLVEWNFARHSSLKYGKTLLLYSEF